MENHYGSDFMTIVDEDGTEFELEVLSTLDYDGSTYLAVIPAGAEEGEDLEVSILKNVEEGGEIPTELDQRLASTVAEFLGRQMES